NSFAVPTRQACRKVQCLERRLMLSQPLQRLSQLHVADPKFRIDGYRLTGEPFRGGKLPAGKGNLRGKCMMPGEKRIELARAAYGFQCFVVAPHMRKHNPQ